MKKFFFSKFGGLQAYSRQRFYQMNSFAGIFRQHFGHVCNTCGKPSVKKKISNFKICERVFLQVKIPIFPNRVRLVGGHFGQNGQKVHESYKPNIFRAKQWVNKNFKFMWMWLLGFSCIMTLNAKQSLMIFVLNYIVFLMFM